MRKIVRIVGLVVAAAVVVLAGLALVVNVRGIPHYDVPTVPARTVAATPARLAQGEKIAVAMCADCHLDRATQAFTGMLLPELPKEFGRLYSSNITQHPVFGVGRWTDAELIGLLRTGIGRDGRYRVVMPKFPHMSDEDINSLVVFLRSNHAWVQPKAVVSRAQEPTFLTKVLTNTVMKPLPPPARPIVEPAASDPVALGRYLVTARYQCYECHSKNFQTNDALEPEKSAGYLGGGNDFVSSDGSTIHSRNLTPDPDTGLGDWTEAQFTQAVKFGLSPHGPLRYPMPKYSVLSDEETRAIFAYLQTVPAIKNPVPASKLAVVAHLPLYKR